MRNKTPGLTRRAFSRGLAASLALPSLFQAHALTVRGVRLGVQTYSFHKYREGGEQAILELGAALKRSDVDLIELFAPQIQPFPTPAWSWSQWEHPPSLDAVASKRTGDEEQQRVQLRDWASTLPTATLSTRARNLPQMVSRFIATTIALKRI